MTNAQTDLELLHKLRQGDRYAYTHIYERYWKNLFGSAYKRLRNKEQCQDIVQTVFSDLWRRREKIIIEDLSAYLHTATRFQVFNQISRSPSSCEFLEEFDVLLSSPIQADNELIEKQTLQLVKLWVDALPEKRKAIFLMHTNEGYTTREIAVKFGISQKTVQNQINTVITMLRTRIAQLFSLFITVYSYFK